MTDLVDMLDLGQLRLLAEACALASGLGTTIRDARDGVVLARVGGQICCAVFRCAHALGPEGCDQSGCAEPGNDEKEYSLCRCVIGLRQVELPLILAGSQAATISLAPFLLDTDSKEGDFFQGGSDTSGVDQSERLRALEGLPVVSRTEIEAIMGSIRAVCGLTASLVEKNLRLRQEDAALHRSDERFRFLVEHAYDSIWHFDPDLTVTYASPADERMRGYAPSEVLGRCFFDLVPADQVQQLQMVWARYMRELRTGFTQGSFRAETPLVCRTGKLLWVETLFNPIRDAEGDISGFHCVARDVSQRRAREEERLYLCTHDPLTGLFNRAHFDGEFGRVAKGLSYPLSLILADVDGLQLVNEKDGRESGDRLLRGVGEMLRAVFQQGELAARLGEDDFAVLLPKTTAQDVREAMTRIREEQERFNRKHGEFAISLALGCATAATRDELKQLFPKAEWNMYGDKAVNSGRG